LGLRRAGVFQPLAAGSQAVLMPGLKRHIRPVERIGLDKSLSIRTTARRREGGPRLEDRAADDDEADPPWAREAVALAAFSTHSSP